MTSRFPFFLCLVVLHALPGSALADDHAGTRVPLLTIYKQECGSCHTPFPPGMLPATSWQRVMNNLGQHYGTDASLDEVTAKQIGTWLAANAGTYKRVREAPPQDRITKSAWFVRKHDEVPPRAWTSATVKTPANCGACHPKAAEGAFNEHDVRIPR